MYAIALSFQHLINCHRTPEPEIVKLFLRGETASSCTAGEADEVPPGTTARHASMSMLGTCGVPIW